MEWTSYLRDGLLLSCSLFLLLLYSCLATSTQKERTQIPKIWLRIPEAQLGFLLPVGPASGRPMASLCCFCYFGGTWCSRHVSQLGGTTASSKLAALSRFSSPLFSFFSLCTNCAHKCPATQSSGNHTVCVRNSHIRRAVMI